MFNGAVPAFDLGPGGLVLALVRGLTVAGLLSAFGALLFRSVVQPPAFARLPAGEAARLDGRVIAVARWSLGLAGLALLGWLPLQASSMSGAHSAAGLRDATRAMLADTMFGHVALLQLAGLAATGALMRVRRQPPWMATAMAGLTLALQSAHSHSATMYPGPSLLLASELMHLLAAGAWVGGLLPLLVIICDGTPMAGAMACRYFSPLGKWCVVLLLLTAVVQFGELIGGFADLVGTGYGWVATFKMLAYGALFAFALLNRYTLAPRLMGGAPAPTRRLLMRSIAVQTVVGLAAVLAAGLLSQLEPSIHAEPVWPFTVAPSLVTVREDPEFAQEVLRAAVALLGAVAIAGLAVVWRRRRWFAAGAVAVAAALCMRAVPHLDLLFVPATATSFYRSPTSFAAESILAGAALYPAHCAGCHGAAGRGDGPAGKGLAVPPADLTAPHLWDHSDGELFGWIANGMEGPEGGLAMPGFAPGLDDDDIWALIDFVRAHNAGASHAASGTWPVPVPAPSFQVRCGGAEPEELSALRGQVVRLMFGGVPPAAASGVVTVLAGAESGASRGATAPGLCAADDTAVRGAYAVVVNGGAAGLNGEEILIDANGWLREARPLDAAPDGPAVAAIMTHPLQVTDGGGEHHHQ